MQKFLSLTAVALLATAPLHAHEAIDEMAFAADQFLKTLTEEQTAIAHYTEVTADERENWHFIPKPFEGEGKRGGLPMIDMRGDQRALAHALLSSGMSHKGYATALTIMSLEQVLFEMEQAPKRNPNMYYVSIFGTPGSNAWGWRVEGHHLSVNFTIANGNVVSGTPIFFASNPGKITKGPRKGLRVLAAEEDIARTLVHSLDEKQAKTAIFADKAPKEILTEANRKAEPQKPDGIPYPNLTVEQQKQLHQLIEVYVRRLRPQLADADLQKIKTAGHDNIVFAWAGGLKMGEPHYYRVQGPTFILEYANTQNNAYHVHAVWRDFDGDFGRDILAEHYEKH